MSLIDQLKSICCKVQARTSTHQKSKKILHNLYKKTPNEFQQVFRDLIKRAITVDQNTSKYLTRLLDFCSAFVVNVAEENDKTIASEEQLSQEELSTNPFLADIFSLVLQYHDYGSAEVRYRSCHFVTLLLKHLGNNSFLDNDICDKIQEAMLDRIVDIKPMIRSQAVTALARLQEPLDPDCPVVKAFLHSLGDPNATVRKQVIEMLAISHLTVPRIVERVRDVDHTVRLASYNRCAIIGPKNLKIESRQTVLMNGFKETNQQVKKYFLETLLPRWLAAYNGNYLQLLSAVKLDAYETDFMTTEFLNINLLEVYFKLNPMKEIMEFLPIDENKIIPLDKLSIEAVIFWRVLANYLRRNAEDLVDSVLPPLPMFCEYVLVFFKDKTTHSMEMWVLLEFQLILANLLLIVKEYDFSDEACRLKIVTLVENLLSSTNCSNRIIDELVQIYAKIVPNVEKLTMALCQIIANIREPLVEEAYTEAQIREKEVKIAKLRVKFYTLKEDQEDAIEQQDFEKAALLKTEISAILRQIDEIEEQFKEGRTVTKATPRNDNQTLNHCLDILIALLRLPQLKVLTLSIMSAKDELILPSVHHSDPEVYVRAIYCLSLCCMLNYDWALKHLKPLTVPVKLYRSFPNHDKKVLETSIKLLADLTVIHGSKLFNDTESRTLGDTEDGQTTSQSGNDITNRHNKTRRLYTVNDTDPEELANISEQTMSISEFIDILLDILDDEHEDLRICAGSALCNLLKKGIIQSASILARLILKWLNPATERHDVKLQQILGTSLLYFAGTVHGSEEFLENAVVPVLSSITKAPRASPLADVDLDNTVKFLAAITAIKHQQGPVNSHINLARTLCHTILKKPDDVCVPVLVKMLLNLELPFEDPIVAQELRRQVELVLQKVTQKAPVRNLRKYQSELDAIIEASNKNTPMETETIKMNDDNNDEEVRINNDDNSGSNEEAVVKNGNEEQSEGERNDDTEDESASTTESSDEEDATEENEAVQNGVHKRRTRSRVNDNVEWEGLRKKSRYDELMGKESRPKEMRQRVLFSGNNNRKGKATRGRRISFSDESVSSTQTRSSARISDAGTSTSVESAMSRLNVSDSVKRRKSRRKSSRGADVASIVEETVLRTIVYEDDHEVQNATFSDEELSTTATTNSKSTSSSPNENRNKVVVTETSSDSESSSRRSRRTKKPRSLL